MGNFIYGMVQQIAGETLSSDLQTWMDSLIGAISDINTNLQGSTAVKFLSAMGCALMIIYFFMDLTSQASRDMFSFEKLVVAFIKLLVAFALLLYVGELTQQIITLVGAFKDLMKNISITSSDAASISIAGVSEYEKEFKGVLGALRGIPVVALLLVPWLISWVCELVGKFLTASTVLQFLARAVLCPLAIVQCFEDGTRSSGIRYIKGLLADGMSLGAMLLILNMAHAIGLKMIAEIPTSFAFDNPGSLASMGISEFSVLIITSLLCVGGMAGASKITHDVMGA